MSARRKYPLTATALLMLTMIPLVSGRFGWWQGPSPTAPKEGQLVLAADQVWLPELQL